MTPGPPPKINKLSTWEAKSGECKFEAIVSKAKQNKQKKFFFN
jgi:hypothetical protein